jgi:hypothetical protein
MLKFFLYALLNNVSCLIFSSFVFASFVIYYYICILFIKELMLATLCLYGWHESFGILVSVCVGFLCIPNSNFVLFSVYNYE